jgi:hypothetical protein
VRFLGAAPVDPAGNIALDLRKPENAPKEPLIKLRFERARLNRLRKKGK